MSRTCFVIMPFTDVEPYQKGHFNLVYEYIIKPACIKAGFEPIRGDDFQETDYIILSVIEHLLNADVAICDLSSKNPNVLYELGLRQAFDKPVTLIKDSITPRIFDVLGYRDIQYDENLRIDSVTKTIESLAKTLANDFEKGSNSLSKILGVKTKTKREEIVISDETELLLNSFSTLNDKISQIEKSLVIPTHQFEKSLTRPKIANVYSIYIDISNFSNEADDINIYNYGDQTTFRNLLDDIFFQIVNYGIEPFTYEFDWIVFNETTNTEIHVLDIEKKKRLHKFNDSRSLASAGIYPFNKIIVLKK